MEHQMIYVVKYAIQINLLIVQYMDEVCVVMGNFGTLLRMWLREIYVEMLRCLDLDYLEPSMT